MRGDAEARSRTLSAGRKAARKRPKPERKGGPMARRLLFLRVLTPLYAAPLLLAAQRPRFGSAAGKSFVGGGDSRTLVDAGGFNVTGADQAGFHIRGMAEVPLNSAAFAFRAEVFYNTLHSHPNSVAIVGSGSGAAALYDRTF